MLKTRTPAQAAKFLERRRRASSGSSDARQPAASRPPASPASGARADSVEDWTARAAGVEGSGASRDAALVDLRRGLCQAYDALDSGPRRRRMVVALEEIAFMIGCEVRRPAPGAS